MEFASLTTVEGAQELFFESVPGWAPEKQTIPVVEALGRVLAETVESRVAVPAFSRSTVDGYAVRARDTFGASDSAPAYLELTGEVTMGEAAHFSLGEGEAAAIATGGMLPANADAAVMIEYTDRTPAGQVELRRPVAPYENVIQKGDDVAKGQVVAEKGRRIRPQDMGALAGIGRTTVNVYERPSVAVISTGDEIVSPDAEPGPGEIRDINSWSLAGQIRQDGGRPLLCGIVEDESQELLTALDRALDSASIVLISGGSSVGTRDVAAQVINSCGEPGVLVHGVTLRPGKPTILAVVRDRPVYGMPGHPVSAMVVYRLFVRPMLRRFMGCSEEQPPHGYTEAVLSRNVRSDPGRTDYVQVALKSEEGEQRAVPVLGASGLITTMTRADGFVRVPLGSDGIRAGSPVRVYLFKGL
jgi:molybdopterin molybdotransferase